MNENDQKLIEKWQSFFTTCDRGENFKLLLSKCLDNLETVYLKNHGEINNRDRFNDLARLNCNVLSRLAMLNMVGCQAMTNPDKNYVLVYRAAENLENGGYSSMTFNFVMDEVYGKTFDIPVGLNDDFESTVVDYIDVEILRTLKSTIEPYVAKVDESKDLDLNLKSVIEVYGNNIAVTTRRGNANIIVASPKIAELLAQIYGLNYTPGTAKIEKVGMINGEQQLLMCDNSATEDYLIIGYVGCSAVDAGAFFPSVYSSDG